MIDLSVLAYSLITSILFLTIVFVVALRRTRFDLIDVAWGLTFIAIAMISYTTLSQDIYSVQSLVTALICIWGIRLSAHIYTRWSKSSSEDKRYAALRERYRQKSGLLITMYTRVFLLQAVLAVVIMLPVIAINAGESAKPGLWTLIGTVIWVIGFYFETVGDYQLRKHIANPKNKGTLLTTGLWKYTRHPNYFGELTQWWGIFVIVVPLTTWWVVLLGPVVISILILFVSGVPLTEKHFEKRAGWSEYRRRTSKFLPMPPKKV